MRTSVIIFVTISLFQVVFTIYQLILFKRKEFLFYILYILLFSGFISAKSFLSDHPSAYFSTSEDPFVIGRGIVLLSFAMYYKFIRHFAEVTIYYPKLKPKYAIAEGVLLATGCLDILGQLLGVSFAQTDKLIILLHFVNIVFSVYIYYVLFKQKNSFSIIAVTGSLVLTAGMCMALFHFLFFTKNPAIDLGYLIYAQAGIIGEYLIFGFGMIYKTAIIQKDNLRLVVEKHEQVQKERERIITDLHDDVGATLSSLNIYGDLAVAVWDTQPQESRKMIEKISVTSRDLMSRMGDIIWSMKPANEEKYTLEARLKNYSSELLSPKNIVCEFDIDEKLAASITNPEVRKNILLIAKEAINNIAKYSEASKADVTLKQQNETVLLTISDNGKGYEAESIKPGNGLQNIKQRCLQLQGSCTIKSTCGNGVCIDCSFPFRAVTHNL